MGLGSGLGLGAELGLIRRVSVGSRVIGVRVRVRVRVMFRLRGWVRVRVRVTVKRFTVGSLVIETSGTNCGHVWRCYGYRKVILRAMITARVVQ